MKGFPQYSWNPNPTSSRSRPWSLSTRRSCCAKVFTGEDEPFRWDRCCRKIFFPELKTTLPTQSAKNWSVPNSNWNRTHQEDISLKQQERYHLEGPQHPILPPKTQTQVISIHGKKNHEIYHVAPIILIETHIKLKASIIFSSPAALALQTNIWNPVP